MIKKVAAYIKENHLVEPGQSILIGLSGGPDSVVLLHLLNSLKNQHRVRLGAVHLNHSIRKRAAAQEQLFCLELCKRFGVEFYEEIHDVPALAKKWKISLESAARRCRYDLFERISVEHGFDLVATGHHKNDQAETVLFRLIRGSARSGLVGMAPKRGIYIRPMLSITRDEILAYANKHRLDFKIDLSNEDESYSRNFVRQKLIPMIEAKLNRSVVNQLVQTAELFAAEEEFLNMLVSKEIDSRLTVRLSGKLQLDLKDWPDLDLWLKRRIVRYCLIRLSAETLPPDKETVDRLLVAIETRQSELTLPGRIRAVQNSGKLYLASATKVAFNRELKSGGEVEIGRLNMTFRAGIVRPLTEKPSRRRRTAKVILAAEAVKLPLRVRSIKPGDRFRPLGLNGSKKVGDFLTDLKIPALLRDEIPVVCDSEGIIWLAGYEIADRVKICNTTKEVFTIEFFATDNEAHAPV